MVGVAVLALWDHVYALEKVVSSAFLRATEPYVVGGESGFQAPPAEVTNVYERAAVQATKNQIAKYEGHTTGAIDGMEVDHVDQAPQEAGQVKGQEERPPNQDHLEEKGHTTQRSRRRR